MKRTELKRKIPLRSRAAKPKVKHRERTAHLGRTKRKIISKTALEKRHLGRVAAMPCIVPSCRKHGPSTVHHVRRRPDRRGLHARVHYRVVPLCPPHHFHDHGPESVEILKERGFLERFGIDLWAEAERLWEESCADPS